VSLACSHSPLSWHPRKSFVCCHLAKRHPEATWEIELHSIASMKASSSKAFRDLEPSAPSVRAGMSTVERREWWLWSSAVLVMMLLTMGIASFLLPLLRRGEFELGGLHLPSIVRGLVGLVLLFDIHVVYQQLQIHRIRRLLLEREELFRVITENAADMIAVVDTKGRFLYSSPAYERILGYAADELRQTTVFDQIHPADCALLFEATQAKRSSGNGRRVEYRIRHRDGNWCMLESTTSAIVNAQGEVQRFVIVNRDITARKSLEDQFRQSQKMEAVGRLSGGIAHDFNNILGVIIGYAEILQEKLEPGNRFRGCADEILLAGRRAASLTRQLLAFSRQQVLASRVLELNAVIADTEKMLRRVIGEDIELNTNLSSELGRVKADQSQIEQVILNLAVNARDAMPEGGTLTITTENTELDTVAVRRYSYPVKPGRYVLLSVNDTGVGMDVETQARIFDPFFTTKEKAQGTGLGLSTVYGVVKQSDGYIHVNSEIGVGTTFKIYLPLLDQPADPEPGRTESKPPQGGAETILLVEDEDMLRTLTRNVLELLGYAVLEAANGQHACALSEQQVSPIDLLLTDVVMPGMNGPALAQRLMASRPGLKILYTSGYTGQGIGQGVLPELCHFIPKPFTREDLARKIREVLDDSVLPPGGVHHRRAESSGSGEAQS
jgi:two-component system cell cycle sensor histidine kinase/response regulator CckA